MIIDQHGKFFHKLVFVFYMAIIMCKFKSYVNVNKASEFRHD